jgi:hypothetical protein
MKKGGGQPPFDALARTLGVLFLMEVVVTVIVSLCLVRVERSFDPLVHMALVHMALVHMALVQDRWIVLVG